MTRILPALIVALLLASPAWAQPTIRAQASNTVDASTSGGPTLNGLQVGDTIICKVGTGSGVLPTGVSSGLDGAFTVDSTRNSNFAARIYRLVAASAGNHAITISFGSSQTFRYACRAWTGLLGTLGGAANNTGDDQATITHGSVTSVGSSVIEAFAQIGGGASSFGDGGDGFTVTDIAAHNRGIEAYKVSSGETTTAPISTNGSVSFDTVVAWYPAAGDDPEPPEARPKRLLLLGVGQ